MKLIQLAAGAGLAVAVASSAMAEQPSRGFLIEQGNVAAKGAASIDLGTDGAYATGGVRLGLGAAEVILNSSKTNDVNQSEAIVKFGLPAISGMSELKHSWSVYGGLSLLNQDDNTNSEDFVNLLVGAAFTATVEKLELTVAPELVIDDLRDDTYVNIGLGAHFSLGKTQYGTFKPGIEVAVTTQDDADTLVGMGVRWEFNDRLNLDVVPVILGGNDTVSLPGQFRVNMSF